MRKKFLTVVLVLMLVTASTIGEIQVGNVSLGGKVEMAQAAISGNYEYKKLSDGTVEITLYSGDETTLDIPETIVGKKVTSIGEYDF